MKKSLKITALVLAVIVILLMVLPIAFRGKIKELVLSEGNKMLNAEFYFDELDISLISDFPKASLTLNDFWLKGVDEFQNDTLIQAEKISASVNLLSLFGDSGYDITKIQVRNTSLKAIVLENGKANWDIMKTDSTTVAATATETATPQEESAFRIQLKKLSLEGINILFDNRQSNMLANLHNLNLTCSGDMSADHTTLDIESEIEKMLFRMGNIPFLSDANIYARMDVDADLKNQKFTLKENKFRLNAIEANLDGWVALTGAATDMVLRLNTPEIDFKEILSLIPAIYAKDFASLQTTGHVSMQAFAKGSMEGDKLPQFELALQVKEGTFRYPALPAGVDNIQVSLAVSNPGDVLDQTVISVQPFSFKLAGNPFSLTADIKTPISDPDFKFSAIGTLNLGKIKEVYPLEEMELNGIVDANMNVMGKLSYIEKEIYDRIAASGNIKLKEMILKTKGMPDVAIRQSTFGFTPQYLTLSETTVNIGDNDLTADCKLENYMAYALKGKTLKGTLNLRSNLFNLNDFMTAEEDSVMAAATPNQETITAEAPAESSEATGVIRIPKNIDFNMNVNMKKGLFDNMTLADLNGKLLIKDGTADMKNLSMQTLDGKVVMNGAYSTAKENPSLNASFAMTNLSFAQTFKELDMIQQMAPIFEGLKGNFSGNMKLATELDGTMSPLMNTLQASGSLQTKDLSLSGVKAIDQIADAVKKPDLKNITVKDLDIDFEVKDGRLSTDPFDIKLGTTTLNLSGSTGLDKSIDYTGKIKLPASSGVAQLTTVDLKIGGTFTSPSVSIDTKSMAKQAAQSVANQALDKLGQKLELDSATTANKDSLKQQVKEKAVNKALDFLKKKLK